MASIPSLPFPQRSQTERLSLLQGPLDPPLVDLTLHDLLDLQSFHNGNRECIVIPWTGARWTYIHLNQQGTLLAAALLETGVRPGDRVGIMAGNCEQYAAVFFAVARLGGIFVILNNTYTDSEALYALEFTSINFSSSFLHLSLATLPPSWKRLIEADCLWFAECKVFFTTKSIGRLDNTKLLSRIGNILPNVSVIILRGASEGFTTYDDLLKATRPQSLEKVFELSTRVLSHQVCNLQFTSGTTGNPKAAMLTHQ